MPSTMHVFDYLDGQTEAPSVCVVFGNEPFFKRLAIGRLRKSVFGDEDAPYTTFDGDAVQWRDVSDELATMSLFGGDRRFVLVEAADKFVTRHRDRLEAYAQKPQKGSVLVLEVGTWASNTRLYKTLNKTGLQIECRPPERARGKRKYPDTDRVKQWLVTWAARQHEVELKQPAVDLLLELVGLEFGLLDQELAKLALFAGPGGKIDAKRVADVVGGWRTKTIWELVDAAADGDTAQALQQLHHLLAAGEHPVALFGQIAWSLRRLASATRAYEAAQRRRQPISLRDALIEAGIPHWNRQGLQRAEAQLKQLGRHRAGHIYQWLLEADLALKGTHSSPHRARFVLERLLTRLAKPLRQTRPAPAQLGS